MLKLVRPPHEGGTAPRRYPPNMPRHREGESTWLRHLLPGKQRLDLNWHLYEPSRTSQSRGWQLYDAKPLLFPPSTTQISAPLGNLSTAFRMSCLPRMAASGTARGRGRNAQRYICQDREAVCTLLLGPNISQSINVESMANYLAEYKSQKEHISRSWQAVQVDHHATIDSLPSHHHKREENPRGVIRDDSKRPTHFLEDCNEASACLPSGVPVDNTRDSGGVCPDLTSGVAMLGSVLPSLV